MATYNKDTNPYSSVHVRYIDADGTPRSESLDEYELNNLEVDMNTIFKQYQESGVQKLVMEVTFTSD